MLSGYSTRIIKMSSIKLGKEVGILQTGNSYHVNRIYWIISDFLKLETSWWRSPSFFFMGNHWHLFLFFDGFLRSSDKWIEIGFVCSCASSDSLPKGQTIQVGIEGSSREISKKHKLDTAEHFFPLFTHSYLQSQKDEWLRQKDEWLFEGNIRVFFAIETPKDYPETEMLIETKAKMGKEECEVKDNTAFMEASTKTEEDIGVRKLQMDLKDFLQNGNFSDVILKLDGQEFKSHRFMLAARSPVFLAMMTHDTVEKKTGVVDIQDVDPNTFPDFLNYLYTGSIENLTSDNASKLYITADRYQVNDLKKLCIDHMLKNISVENFCDLITISLRHEEKDLTEACYQFFAKNSLDIVLTPKWQMFLSENPIAGNELFIKHLQLNK